MARLSELEFGVSLPDGYFAEQEEDFVILKNGEGEVARFSSWGFNLKEIEKEAWDHYGLAK